jgi:hypothetical protein
LALENAVVEEVVRIPEVNHVQAIKIVTAIDFAVLFQPLNEVVFTTILRLSR